ncbi:hypothetical protein RKD23_007688 [Streptomyces sp. SAI-170]|uniref:RICIN domain-containing protein n=1 Tax=Streptomyces sp. SAI-170 TaxID=3377729 RepID=UPI003C7DB30D
MVSLLTRTAAALACSAALLFTSGTAQALPAAPAQAARQETAAGADSTGVSRNTRQLAAAATYTHVINVNSNQCLSVPGGSTTAGTGLAQWPCGSWNDHYWSFQYAFSSGGVNYYRLENLNSHQCLAVPGGSTTAGTQVIQWPCGTWRDHYWGVRNTSAGSQLVNYNSGQCLAVAGGSTAAGAKVIQWPCGTWRDHYWYS